MPPNGAGRCVLVDVPPAAEALLAGLGEVERVRSAGLEATLTAADGPVDLVVVGPVADSAVAVVQRVHRLLPDAAVAVLTDDPDGVRRQSSFAPGVPLDLLVTGVDDADLPARLRQLRRASTERRRHAAVLAAVSRHTAPPDGGAHAGPTAVGALLEHAPIAVFVANPGGELLGWNRRAELLLGLRPVRSGQSVDEVIPGALALMAAVAAADAPGMEPEGLSPRLQARVGRVDVELSAVASQTDQGRPVVLLLAADVTAQREAERERDRLAGHVQLLERISELLMESLDLSESLSRLVRALVPGLADWVSIQLREEHDQLYGVAMHHRDPGLAAVVLETEELKLRRGCVSEPGRRAAAGERVLLPRVDPGQLAQLVPDPELRALLARLGMGSVVAVPVPGRVGVLGALLLVNGPDGDRLGEADLALAVEIGRRAGIALDNARLYAGQRHVATELQRSLLSPPPTPDYADIAVRYVAAAEEAQVGGDWYDAFRRRTGDLMVVIGDVAGHDTRAAAAMGQLRALVRGIGFTTDAEPSWVLTSLDEAIRGLELATLATAVLAELAPRDGAGEPPGVRLRWSNAGHPSPVLLDPEGRARLLDPDSGRADLLLGLDPTWPRTTEQTCLPAGSTLLLYTDGLVERRGQSLDDGQERLLAVVEAHAGENLESLCDAVLARMVPQAGEDDVALLAVRPRGRRG